MMSSNLISRSLKASFFIFSLLISQISFAITSELEGTIVGGISRVSVDMSSMKISQFETDRFSDNNEDHNEATGGVGLGYIYLLNDENGATNKIISSVSLALYYYIFQTSQKGDVLQYGLPQFNNYTYKLDVDSQRVMLNAEVHSQPIFQMLSLFLQAAVGAAHNEIRYSDTPKAGISGGGINLSKQTQNNVAFDVGGGIKVPINSTMAVSLRYLYSYLGDPNTKTHGSVSLAKPIEVDLRAQSLLLGFTMQLT